jgi:hypothetical protein
MPLFQRQVWQEALSNLHLKAQRNKIYGLDFRFSIGFLFGIHKHLAKAQDF